MTKNQKYSFNSAQALWNQRFLLHKNRKRLKNLANTVSHLHDSSLSQYAQLFTTTLEFNPSLIIELGRGWGNSTAVLNEAAQHLPDTRKVLSICQSDHWQKQTAQRITRIVKPKWFEKLDTRIVNILDSSLARFIRKSDRVLFFWDAHGLNIAEYLLSTVFPVLEKTRHLILVHDITDIQYTPEIKKYSKTGVWKGYEGNTPKAPYLILNNMASRHEELILINDFLERNNIVIHSTEHELRKKIFKNTDQLKELTRLAGKDMILPDSSIYHFALKQNTKNTIYYPSYQRKKINRHVSFRTKPLVSIVTPCFNSGKYLENCIKSVLYQDYLNIEHIIQDGASADKTKDILKKYTAKKYKNRIKIVSEPDKGQSDGLNKALKRAKGDILLVLNADDELMPNACSWGIQQLEKNRDCAVVYGDEYFVDENGTILTHYTGKYPYDYKKLFCVELVPPAQAAFIRRSMLERVGFFADKTLSTCPDFEMWVRLGAKYPMKHEFGIVCKYRHHRDSEGKRPDIIPKMVQAKKSVIDKILKDKKTPESIRKLKRRAYAGLYHWGANMAASVGLYKKELQYLLLSIFYKPKLHKIIRLVRFLFHHIPQYFLNRLKIKM